MIELKEYIKLYCYADKKLDILSEKLNSFEKDDMGLTLDSVTSGKEFKELKKEFNILFEWFREFNKATKREAKEVKKIYGRKNIHSIEF